MLKIAKILFKVEIFILIIAFVFVIVLSKQFDEPIEWNYYSIYYEADKNITYREALHHLYEVSTSVRESNVNANTYYYQGQFVFYSQDYMIITFYWRDDNCYLQWYYFKKLDELRRVDCNEVRKILVVNSVHHYVGER